MQQEGPCKRRSGHCCQHRLAGQHASSRLTTDPGCLLSMCKTRVYSCVLVSFFAQTKRASPESLLKLCQVHNLQPGTINIPEYLHTAPQESLEDQCLKPPQVRLQTGLSDTCPRAKVVDIRVLAWFPSARIASLRRAHASTSAPGILARACCVCTMKPRQI